jgi:hypothetical protein
MDKEIIGRVKEVINRGWIETRKKMISTQLSAFVVSDVFAQLFYNNGFT